MEFDDMEALPKIVRQRLRLAAKPGIHPHADLLTAFAEKALTERERARVVEHLSRCEDCREVVFLAVPREDPVQIIEGMPRRSGWFGWSTLRWGTAIACVAVVGTAVSLLRERQPALKEKLSSEEVQRADSQLASAPAATTAETRKPEGLQSAAPARKKEATTDQLAAKLEEPMRPAPKAMTATPKVRMQFDRSPSMNDQAVSGGAIGASAETQPVVPPQPAKDINEVTRSEQEQNRVGSSSDTSKVSSRQFSQPVEVTASSPAMEADKTLAKNSPEPVDALPMKGRAMQSLASPARDDAKQTAQYAARALTRLAPHWTLSTSGALQRSWDNGKTWEIVVVADKASFQTLAAIASEIWVGGASGLLYHSSDAGIHWIHIVPQSGSESLSAGIARIEFSNVQNGKITTSNGEIWTTSDAGKTWQKN